MPGTAPLVWTWDQKDFTYKQVPPGDYILELFSTNAGTKSATIKIKQQPLLKAIASKAKTILTALTPMAAWKYVKGKLAPAEPPADPSAPSEVVPLDAPPVDPEGGIVGQLGAVIKTFFIGDPPDPDYKEFAEVNDVLARLHDSGVISVHDLEASERARKNSKAYIRVVARIYDYTLAIGRTLEKAQGAQYAGERGYVESQLQWLQKLCGEAVAAIPRV